MARARAHLHVVTPDGRERSFVTGDASVSNIAWTPDGSGISFLTRRATDDHRSLYVIPRDGGEARMVVGHDSSISEYAWSPDGRRVAFLAQVPTTDAERDLERKGFNQIVYEESARPVRVADVPSDDIATHAWVMDLPGSASRLRWSPTSARFALLLAPTPLIDDEYMRRKLHIVDFWHAVKPAVSSQPASLGSVPTR